MFVAETVEVQPAVIKVVGVGGGGCNAVQHMLNKRLSGVDFIGINTDVQALSTLKLEKKLAIGGSITGGLGAGAKPEVGRQAALEDAERIGEHLEGAHMVFVAAGMGGGTGTGAAPEVARLAREKGILTVAVVTRPFELENRDAVAEEGLARLREVTDSLIVIANDKLRAMNGGDMMLLDAFASADDVLLGAVEGIADLVLKPGIMNVDFADVRTVMTEMGSAMMGTGSATGESRARQATKAAIDCPLLDGVEIRDAGAFLVNITSSAITMAEFEDVLSMVRERASEHANIIRGWVLDDDIADTLKVTIVATGLGRSTDVQQPPVRPVESVRNPISYDQPPNFPELEAPTWERMSKARQARAAASGAAPAMDREFELLDVPGFLQRQAD